MIGFEGLQSKNVVILGDTVQCICEKAFESCESLETVWLPESVFSLENRAFYDCFSLKSINLDNVSIISSESLFSTAIDHVTLGSNLTIIKANSFGMATQLYSITVNSSKIKIENEAFFNVNLSKLIMINVDWSNSETQIGTLNIYNQSILTIYVGDGQIESAKNKLNSSNLVSGDGSVLSSVYLTDGVTTYTWNGSAWV